MVFYILYRVHQFMPVLKPCFSISWDFWETFFNIAYFIDSRIEFLLLILALALPERAKTPDCSYSSSDYSSLGTQEEAHENHEVFKRATQRRCHGRIPAAIPIVRSCWSKFRGTVLRGLPPKKTTRIWTTTVIIAMAMNQQLLKRPANTLYSLS